MGLIFEFGIRYVSGVPYCKIVEIIVFGRIMEKGRVGFRCLNDLGAYHSGKFSEVFFWL